MPISPVFNGNIGNAMGEVYQLINDLKQIKEND